MVAYENAKSGLKVTLNPTNKFCTFVSWIMTRNSSGEFSLGRHRTRSTKYNRLLHKL